ncbi:MAG: protein kinase [Polyangiaceae bacterium]|nr:protein kinase [Polyangiaceae bacterium]
MAGPSLQAVCEARIGRTLRDKWTLEKLVGVGGMAAVYVAAHKIGRREAVKILHPEIARSRELVARFEQEAKAVNRFTHPHSLEVRDIDTAEDGCPFMVMELLEGENLAERAGRLGGLPPEELLSHVDVLLDVLAAAHAQGIVHRDVKLDNLFLTTEGKIKVLDFGIARVTSGPALTRMGARLGTTAYMAPEQVRGEDIDGRTDIFAVGATMFRVTAKRRIHDASTESELLIKMGSQPAPSLGSVVPSADRGLVLVVDRALEFHKADRYPDAATMQADIRALRAKTSPSWAASRAAGPRVSAPAALSAVDSFRNDPTRAPTAAAMEPTRAPGIAMEPTAAPAASPFAAPTGVPRPQQRTVAIPTPPPGSLMVPSVASPAPMSTATPAPPSVGAPPAQRTVALQTPLPGSLMVPSVPSAVSPPTPLPPVSYGPASYGPSSTAAPMSVPQPSVPYPHSAGYPSTPHPNAVFATVAPPTPQTFVSPSGPPPAKKSSSAPLIVGLLVAACALGAVGIYLAMPGSKPAAAAKEDDDDDDDDRSSKKKSKESAAASAAPAATPAPTSTPATPAEEKAEEKEKPREDEDDDQPSEAEGEKVASPAKPAATGRPAEMPQPGTTPTASTKPTSTSPTTKPRPSSSGKAKDKGKGHKK